MILLEDLSKYVSNNDEEQNSLKEIYISAAEDVVNQYLGYNPVSKEYLHIGSGNNSPEHQLKAQPVTEIKSIKIDGVTFDPEDFICEKERIFHKDLECVFTAGTNNILISYTAGYDEANIPGVIKLTELRIAALMWTEGNGNIGVTSKSFGDSGTRTFVKTTDYSQYLKLLEPIRILRY